jgi:undecaprenyl-diphosphatase
LDWEIVHTLNGALVGREWLEDPITLGSMGLVVVFAAATAGLWLFARPHGLPTWKRACLSALLSAALALGINQLVAHYLWDRPRPFTTHAGSVHLFAGGSLDPSFPSDHAAAAFAIAVAVFFYSRRVGAVFMVAATIIASSRVVEGLHYPSDVLAGAAVGAVAALAVTYLARRVVASLADILGSVTDPIVDQGLRLVSRVRPSR